MRIKYCAKSRIKIDKRVCVGWRDYALKSAIHRMLPFTVHEQWTSQHVRQFRQSISANACVLCTCDCASVVYMAFMLGILWSRYANIYRVEDWFVYMDSVHHSSFFFIRLWGNDKLKSSNRKSCSTRKQPPKIKTIDWCVQCTFHHYAFSEKQFEHHRYDIESIYIFVWIRVCPYVRYSAIYSSFISFNVEKWVKKKNISSNFPLILLNIQKSTREQSTHTQTLIHLLFKSSLNEIV